MIISEPTGKYFLKIHNDSRTAPIFKTVEKTGEK